MHVSYISYRTLSNIIVGDEFEVVVALALVVLQELRLAVVAVAAVPELHLSLAYTTLCLR